MQRELSIQTSGEGGSEEYFSQLALPPDSANEAETLSERSLYIYNRSLYIYNRSLYIYNRSLYIYNSANEAETLSKRCVCRPLLSYRQASFALQ